VAVVDSTVVAEAGDNMTVRTFALAFVVAALPAFGQAPQAASKTAQPSGVKAPAAPTTPKIAQKTFDSPESASQALIDAASKNDTASLKDI